MRNTSLWIFLSVTLFYLLTRWLIFKGFNGTDDLHYAMLAAKMIRGTYDPFQPEDIFSGRMLLISTQALIYKLAGINIITTMAGSILVVIACCHLTIFKLLPVKNAITTLLGSGLFYFNPVITYLTVGITGDIYVMLTGILICLLLKRWFDSEKTTKQSVLTGMLISFIVAVSLLYKETAIAFIPFTCIVVYWHDKTKAIRLIISTITSFLLAIVMYGSLFYYFTGDVFFKISQINNSSYVHHCSYDLLPIKVLLIRLSYGVWQEFIVRGFYPVVLGAMISIVGLIKRKTFLSPQNIYPVSFLFLIIICLYFPFSLKGYQPLCSDARQFMLMLPLGVVVTTDFFVGEISLKTNSKILIFTSLLILVVCIISTGNKWQWMIYILFSIFCSLAGCFSKLDPGIKTLALVAILWLSILEHLFFKNSNWFYDMIKLEKKISSTSYYFPEHDNMMHWEILHQFNGASTNYYNLEKHPFKIFKVYYTPLESKPFSPGWLIINKSYTARSPAFLNKFDSLQQAGYFSNKLFIGDVSAYLIDTPEKLSFCKRVIEEDN